MSKLRKDSLKANAKIGVKNVSYYDLPDNRFDSKEFLDIVKIIEKEIFTFKPNIIYTHSSYDLNIDHKIISKAVITAGRPQNNRFLKKILFLGFFKKIIAWNVFLVSSNLSKEQRIFFKDFCPSL